MSESQGSSQEQVTISQALQNQVSSLKAIATIHDLLQKGSFPFYFASAIDQSLKFTQALHSQVAEEALKDPQANLIPELQALKPKEVENVQS